MTSGDQYRVKAAIFHTQAQCETNAKIKHQFENLGLAYLRLAELADRNATVELVYEPPPPKLSDNPH
jgi:hypothetical protein